MTSFCGAPLRPLRLCAAPLAVGASPPCTWSQYLALALVSSVCSFGGQFLPKGVKGTAFWKGFLCVEPAGCRWRPDPSLAVRTLPRPSGQPRTMPFQASHPEGVRHVPFPAGGPAQLLSSRTPCPWGPGTAFVVVRSACRWAPPGTQRDAAWSDLRGPHGGPGRQRVPTAVGVVPWGPGLRPETGPQDFIALGVGGKRDTRCPGCPGEDGDDTKPPTVGCVPAWSALWCVTLGPFPGTAVSPTCGGSVRQHPRH